MHQRLSGDVWWSSGQRARTQLSRHARLRQRFDPLLLPICSPTSEPAQLSQSTLLRLVAQPSIYGLDRLTLEGPHVVSHFPAASAQVPDCAGPCCLSTRVRHTSAISTSRL